MNIASVVAAVTASPNNVVQDTVVIREWEVPWADTRPRDPHTDDVGRVWFVGQRGDYVAYLDPSTGEFRRYELDAGTGPHNLIVDRDGQVWYAGNRAGHIGRLDPSTGEIVKYPMPDPRAGDPHTLVFDDAGDIWFTVQRGNFVGRLDVRTGDVALIAIATRGARPYGIRIAPDGTPWIALFGTNKIVRVNPRAMTAQEIVLPDSRARPRRLEVTRDGVVWLGDYSRGYLGRYDPVAQSYSEWMLPGGRSSLPYGMALDGTGRIWLVESGPRPNRFVGFDPATSTFLGGTAISSGGGTVRHMYFDSAIGEIWFGTDTNFIGRARFE
ncbi:MAG: lyase [Gemmatimonadetes bacterium]|nr:lyase [Gemmatimonadota bacterium]